MRKDLSEDLPLVEIQRLCRMFGVDELAVFSAAVSGDCDGESDVSFLVRFQSGAERPWLAHFQDLKAELARLLCRDVRLVDKKAVEQSRNWIRRKAILETARVVFAA